MTAAIDQPPLSDRILAFFRERYPTQAIVETVPFRDYGIDSLEILDLMFDLEEELGVDFPDEQLQTWERIQDILDYLDEVKK